MDRNKNYDREEEERKRREDEAYERENRRSAPMHTGFEDPRPYDPNGPLW
jgi:hypothetical protein